MNDSNGKITSDKRFLCGLIAGGIEAATVMTPAEVIKVQSINKNMTIMATLTSVYANNGIAGFWKGGVATTIRQSTTQGTSFMVYDKTKQMYDKIPIIKSSSGMLAGMTGGAMAVLVNNPVDAIKTYKQSDRGSGNLYSIGCEIYETKGLAGFYRGAVLRISRVAPLHGMTFCIYD